MTSDKVAHCFVFSTTCKIIGFPEISHSGLPGNRDDAYRAGMQPTILFALDWPVIEFFILLSFMFFNLSSLYLVYYSLHKLVNYDLSKRDKLLVNQLKITKENSSYILYDAALIAVPTLQLFDGDYHTNSGNQQKNSVSQEEVEPPAGIGRAKVIYFNHNGINMVLKHYYRGGLVAKIVKDRYIGFNVEKTRAFKEFRLLSKMQQLGLPVPAAIAARVEKGPFYFRADLITREIEGVQTLAEFLSGGVMSSKYWSNVGQCIKRFHQHNIFHADLNARNILLSEVGEVYLIDFDNSYIRADTNTWKLANLSRLKRSILKFKKNEVEFNFDEESWRALIDGYDI